MLLAVALAGVLIAALLLSRALPRQLVRPAPPNRRRVRRPQHLRVVPREGA